MAKATAKNLPPARPVGVPRRRSRATPTAKPRSPAPRAVVEGRPARERRCRQLAGHDDDLLQGFWDGSCREAEHKRRPPYFFRAARMMVRRRQNPCPINEPNPAIAVSMLRPEWGKRGARGAAWLTKLARVDSTANRFAPREDSKAVRSWSACALAHCCICRRASGPRSCASTEEQPDGQSP